MAKYHFKQPAPFTAGLPTFNQNTDLSQLITQLGVPLLQGFAGPGSFMPQMSPAQGIVDQHTMSTHQRNMQANTYNTSAMGNDQVTERLVGMASAVAGQPLSDMSKKQAAFAASAINHPITKALLGSVMGPENLEGITHGQKGDVSALAASTNRIGYFRKGPSGKDRMSAGEMGDFTQNMYRELYEPDGNVDEMVSGATAGKAASVKQLQKAAGKEHLKFVKNAEIETRLTDGADVEETAQKQKEVSRLYKKYVAGGKETDVKKQATAVTKIEDAVAESNVLKRDETSVGQLKTAAETAGRRGMHGFSAGQAASLQDDLYQRGMLPKALGAMTPAERVKMIQQTTPRDDASMTDMARKYGHKELMKDSSYAKLDSTEQSSRLDKELKTFKDKLANTLKEVDKTSSGAKGAKSAVSIEGLDGMDMLGSRVDAKRSGAALKSYSGAVAAVREIFGANGNSNAPMPMLLAALDGLAGGAMGQVSSDTIETSLREMNTAAKNAGVGFEELNALSANMQAEGDMRGTAKNVTLKNTVSALTAAQVMRDEGAFSKPMPGAYTQSEALDATKGQIIDATDSTNAKAMSAAVAIYKADPKKYAGSPFEAKVKAYEAGHGDYSYETTDAAGKKTITTGNVNDEIVATGDGYSFAQDLAVSAGSDAVRFDAAFRDPKHSGQYVSTESQYRMYRAEGRQTIANLNRGEFNTTLERANPTQTPEERAKLLDTISPSLTQLTLDSGKDNRDQEAQAQYIIANAEKEFTQAFIKKDGLLPAEAAKKAKQTVKAMELNTPAGAHAALTATNANLTMVRAGGGSGPETIEQYNQGPTDEQLLEGNKKTSGEAAANKKVQEALGFGANPLGRLGDYFAKAGKDGQKITLEGAFKALSGTVKEDEITGALYKDAVPAMMDLQGEYDKHAVTTGYLEKLAKDKDGGAGHQELLKRAQVEPGVKLDTQKERDADYTKYLKTLPPDEIKKRYLRDVQQGKVSDTNESTAAQIAALSKNAGGESATEYDKARYAPGQKLLSKDTVVALAAQNDLGAPQGNTEAEKNKNQRALTDIKAVGTGANNANTDKFVESGLGAEARLLLPNANETQQGALADALTAAALEPDDDKATAAVTKAIAKLPKAEQAKATNAVAAMRAVRKVDLNPEAMGATLEATSRPLTAAAAKESAPQNTKMSDEQKKLIKEIEDAKPADKEALIKGKLRDKDSRELLLTLPDDDMRGMYDKLPEDQKKSTADNIGALGIPGSMWELSKGGAARATLGIPDEDAERFAHIHDVITKPAPEKTAEEKAAAAAEASAAAPPAAAKEKTADAAAAEASAAAIPVAAEQAAGTIAEAIIAAAETAAATLTKLTDSGLKDSSGHSDAEKTPAGEPAATPAQLADADVKKDAPLPAAESTGVTPASAEPAPAALNDLTGDGLKDTSGHGGPEKTPAEAPAAASTQVADKDIDVEATLAARKIDKETDPIYASEKLTLGETVADINYNARKNDEGSYVAKTSPDAEQTTAPLENNTDTGLKSSSGYGSPEKETPVTQATAPATAGSAESSTAADVDEDSYGLNDPEAMRRLDRDLAAMNADKAADPKYARDTRRLGKAKADSKYSERNSLQKRADKLPQTGSDTRTGVFKQGELQPEPAAAKTESGLRWHSDAGGYFSHNGSDELKERTDAGLTTTSGLSNEKTEIPVTQSAAPAATDAAQTTQTMQPDSLKIPELLQTLASIGPNNIRAATATNITASVDSAAGSSGGGGGGYGGGGGGGGAQPLKLTGTLSMQGLTTAILNAQTQTPIHTEGGGAPLMPDGPQSGNRSPIADLAPA